MRSSSSQLFATAATTALTFSLTFFAPGLIGLAVQAQSQQATFATPEAGVAALIDALRRNNASALESLLGPGGRDVLDSGDPVSDAAARDDFVAAFERKSDLVAVNDTTRMLRVGESEWPLPIPLISAGSGWRFDLETGRDELINRRIGRNETNAIEACQAFIDAQQEYASEDRDGDDILEYAQRFTSTSWMKDGLYWPAKEGEPDSPLGPLFAAARAEGYQLGTAAPRSAYYGYRYKILTSQGASAAGGAYAYITDGNMIGGVALIAYPVQYGQSGIMSFMTNHDGVVYQKDLGPQTAEVVSNTTAFDPDDTWQRVEMATPVASAP